MTAPAFIFHSVSQASVADAAWSLAAIPVTAESYPAHKLSAQANALGHIYDVSSATLSEGWLWVYLDLSGTNGAQDAGSKLIELSGPTTALLRITANNTISSGKIQRFEYWNGTAWISIGILTSSINAVARVDIHWRLADTGGVFELYINGALDTSFSGDTLLTSDTIIAKIGFHPPDTSVTTLGYTPFIVDTVDTRGLAWDSSIPNVNGFYVEWTGSESSVDDFIGSGSMIATSAITDADGERLTLNYAGFNAAFAGYAVESVLLLTGGIAQADPGLYLKPLLRSGVTDYEPAGSLQHKAGVTTIEGVRLDLDPSTGLAWADQAAVQAFEMGFKASATA